MRALLFYLFVVFLGFNSFSMEDTPKIRIVAQEGRIHKNIWMACITQNGDRGGMNKKVVSMEENNGNEFVGEIDPSFLQGRITKLGLYIGGSHLYIVEFDESDDDSLADDIEITWKESMSENDMGQNVLSIKMLTQNGQEKNKDFIPINIDQEGQIQNTSNDWFINMIAPLLSLDLSSSDYNF